MRLSFFDGVHQKNIIMSKGTIIDLTKTVSDGHRVVEVTIEGPVIYCPKIKDIKTGTYTSSYKNICPHCGQKF